MTETHRHGPLPPLPDLPLVTIVIPCYNQGQFLADAIDGALSQTHPRIDVIVVDDGSTDNTADVAAAYPPVRYVHQENRGLAAARNRGIQLSTGDCLVFLDSDDRLHPKAVEVGLRHLSLDRRVAFAYGRCNLVGADGVWLATSDRPTVDGDHYGPLLHGNFLPNPAAMIFRRDAVQAVGGFDVEGKGRGAEDYHLCLRLSRAYAARGHTEVVADYRQHDASMSRGVWSMSESVLYALQSQAGYVAAHAEYAKPWRTGMRNWRSRYHAEALLARLRDNARERSWGLVARDALALLRANPRLLLENAGRSIRIRFSGTLPSGPV